MAREQRQWDHEAAADRTARCMAQGFHCSEAILLGAGEEVLGEIDKALCRASSGLAGGIGCGYGEMCGALSGGVMVIGALYGRSEPGADDSLCQRLARVYRERFIEAFGTSHCGTLRAAGYGAGGTVPCSVLVAQATRLLLEVLEEETTSG